MPVEILVTIANVAQDLFTITSILAVGEMVLLLVAAHGFGGHTFVMTLVACLALTIVMHLTAAVGAADHLLSVFRQDAIKLYWPEV
ncbi:hypothetical protein ACFLYD_08490 [Chloroflexota bacterium]